jgi:hypothetical protein
VGGSVASDAEKLAKPTRALFTTNYPLAVPTHVLPSCCALCCCCCCCCCCMLCVRARDVAMLTTDATSLLSPLWLLLLNWLYSCAPLWAGACVVAFPLTHFCCGFCKEEQSLHHQHARNVHMVHMAHTWSSLPTNAPTHQEEQTRLPQHTHGISSTCNQLIMKLKLMNMSRVLAWSSKLSVRASPWLQTQPAHSETSPVHACAFS